MFHEQCGYVRSVKMQPTLYLGQFTGQQKLTEIFSNSKHNKILESEEGN